VNILHINTHDYAGGASHVAWQLAKLLRDTGRTSSILNAIKRTSSENSFVFDIGINKRKLFSAQKDGLLYYEFDGSFELLSNPHVVNADVLHFHNLHGDYFNPIAIIALSMLKPIVWTLHDMQAITGHCAHSFNCIKWGTDCSPCPDLSIYPDIPVDSAQTLLRDKSLIYAASQLNIVSPSEWLGNFVTKSILSNHKQYIIHNAVDTNTFKPLNKKSLRQKYDLSDELILVGAASVGGSLANSWKGGKYTSEFLEKTKHIPNLIFLNIGGDSLHFDGKILHIPYTSSPDELNELFNLLDIFLYTPIADNCPLVVLQALSSGIPILTFEVGGIPELVTHLKSGYLAKLGNTTQLVEGFDWLLKQDLQTVSAFNRLKAESIFNENTFLQKYLSVYEEAFDSFHHPKKLSNTKTHEATQIFIIGSFSEDIEDNIISEISSRYDFPVDIFFLHTDGGTQVKPNNFHINQQLSIHSFNMDPSRSDILLSLIDKENMTSVTIIFYDDSLQPITNSVFLINKTIKDIDVCATLVSSSNYNYENFYQNFYHNKMSTISMHLFSFFLNTLTLASIKVRCIFFKNWDESKSLYANILINCRVLSLKNLSLAHLSILHSSDSISTTEKNQLSERIETNSLQLMIDKKLLNSLSDMIYWTLNDSLKSDFIRFHLSYLLLRHNKIELALNLLIESFEFGRLEEKISLTKEVLSQNQIYQLFPIEHSKLEKLFSSPTP